MRTLSQASQDYSLDQQFVLEASNKVPKIIQQLLSSRDPYTRKEMKAWAEWDSAEGVAIDQVTDDMIYVIDDISKYGQAKRDNTFYFSYSSYYEMRNDAKKSLEVESSFANKFEIMIFTGNRLLCKLSVHSDVDIITQNLQKAKVKNHYGISGLLEDYIATNPASKVSAIIYMNSSIPRRGNINKPRSEARKGVDTDPKQQVAKLAYERFQLEKEAYVQETTAKWNKKYPIFEGHVTLKLDQAWYATFQEASERGIVPTLVVDKSFLAHIRIEMRKDGFEYTLSNFKNPEVLAAANAIVADYMTWLANDDVNKKLTHINNEYSKYIKMSAHYRKMSASK